MATTISQIRDFLRPGLDAVFGEYDMLPAQWPDIYEKHTSEMNVEIDVEVKLTGLAQLRTEGASVAFEDMGERYKTIYTHVGVALGFVMTKFAIRDNLYKQRFGPNTKALRNSMAQTKEVYGAAVLNNALDPNFPIGDGVPALSTAHPIDPGTVANTLTVQAELSETSIQDMVVTIQRFRDAAGLQVMTRPKRLVIGPELQFVADRLTRTQARVGTADNDVNVIRGLIPEGVSLNFFLTNRKSWFITTNADNGLKYFQRDPIETDLFTEFTTDNLMAKATERYSFNISNFRGLAGCMP